MSVTAIAQNQTQIFESTPINHAVLIPIGLASMGIAIITVGLRLYTRYFLTKRLWWDDAMILVALFPCVALSVDGYIAPKFGWGRHAADIPADPWYIVGFLKTLWVSSMTFNLATGFIKCSILIFYLRITSKGAHQTLRIASWVMLTLVALNTLIMTVIICVQCTPVSAYWAILDYQTRVAACAPWAATKRFFFGQGITNIVTDFIVILLPLKYIVELQLPIRQKLVVMTLLCLGLLASISGILRIIYINDSFKTIDTTWEGIATIELGVLEVNTGIVCASVPAIKPLLVSIFPKFERTTLRKDSQESASTGQGSTSQGSTSQGSTSQGSTSSTTQALSTLNEDFDNKV